MVERLAENVEAATRIAGSGSLKQVVADGVSASFGSLP
jgi:hypothetical protein